MIKVDNISKKYKLGQIGGTTLREELQRVWARKRHKEDPTKKIGAKDYNKGETFMALDGVSFEVKKGERVGIIGHNGAGKSTLLKLLSRVTAPTTGEIGLNGRVASMLEVGTGFHGELTGRENIYMNGAILGMTKKEIDAKIEDIIDFSECRQFIDTPVKRYSSGMYVKLAFSVAAHLDSEIMIMDEVLAVGDMAFQKKCLNKMNEVSKAQGRTILYVSHNMNTIRQLCERVIVLCHGKIDFDGAVDDGISIYLGKKREFVNGTIFYTDEDHIFEEAYHHIKIISLSIKDKTDAIFYAGDIMNFEISCYSIKDCEAVSLRISFHTADGAPIATSYSEELSVKKEKFFKLDCSLDISKIRENDYIMSIGMFYINTINLPSCIDFIQNAYRIKIENNPDKKETFRWNVNHYGCIELSPVAVNVQQERR